MALEGAAKSAFRDVVNTFELQAQVGFSETISGRWLWIFGLFMSAVAVLRLIFAVVIIIGTMAIRSGDFSHV